MPGFVSIEHAKRHAAVFAGVSISDLQSIQLDTQLNRAFALKREDEVRLSASKMVFVNHPSSCAAFNFTGLNGSEIIVWIVPNGELEAYDCWLIHPKGESVRISP